MDKLTRLKQDVHNVLGNHDRIQCVVKILPDKPILYECTWQRSYEDSGFSDRRYCEGDSLEIVFRKIIEYEAQADVRDAEEFGKFLATLPPVEDKTCIPPEEVSDRMAEKAGAVVR